MKKELNLDEIKRLYIEENKTLREIAQIMNCGYGTIQKRIKEMGLSRDRFKNTSSNIEEMREKIRHLYIDEKLSSNEIGKIIGKTGKTVLYHLKQMGIEIRPVKKIDQEEFEQLWNQGKSDKEIAEYFGVEETTIKTYRTRGENAGKFNVTRYFSQEEHELSEMQEQMILGSLLGDMSLRLDESNRNNNARLYIVQSRQQEELFMKKVEILSEFMGSYRLYTPNPDKRTGKVYESWRGNSKAHKVFTDIFTLLYPNGIKTITREYLNRITNPIALAYWFMDDGCISGSIATNCFSEQEVDCLINWMKDRWNIICTKQHQLSNFIIYFPKESRLDFECLIFPYMIPSMYYKLKFLDVLKAESV